jgi:hypothetical protein
LLRPPAAFRREGGHGPGHPFSLSYGVNLPSSLARGRSKHLRVLTPVHLCWFAVRSPTSSVRGFSCRCRFSGVPRFRRVLSLLRYRRGGFAYPGTLQGPTRHVQWARSAYLPVSPLTYKRKAGGMGILTHYPSVSPFGLTLGPPNPLPIDVAEETLDLR